MNKERDHYDSILIESLQFADSLITKYKVNQNDQPNQKTLINLADDKLSSFPSTFKKVLSDFETLFNHYGIQNGFRHPKLGEVVKKYKLMLELNGQVSEALRVSNLYLDHLLSKKNVFLAEKFLIETDVSYWPPYLEIVYKIKFSILKNHEANLEVGLTNLMNDALVTKKYFKYKMEELVKIYQEIFELLEVHYSDNQGLLVVREFCIRYYLLQIEKKVLLVTTGKLNKVTEHVDWIVELLKEIREIVVKALNFSLESILLEYKYLPLYLLNAKLYWLLGEKQKAEMFLSFIEKNKRNKSYLGFERIKSEYKNYSLWLKEEKNFISYSLLSRLKELKELKEISRTITFNDSTKSSLGDSTIEKWDRGEDINEKTSKNTLSSYYQNKREEWAYSPKIKREISLLEVRHKKYFSLIEKELFMDYYSDLVVAFCTFGLFGVAHVILDRVEVSETKNGLEVHIAERLKISYLRSILFFKENRLHEAKAVLEYILRSYPLNDEEYLCFAYLMADTLFNLGENKNSLKLYQKVKELNSNYRQVVRKTELLENILSGN